MQSHEAEIKHAAGAGRSPEVPGCSPAQNGWAELQAPHDIRPLVDVDWKNNYV